jgi:hypothetical protein
MTPLVGRDEELDPHHNAEAFLHAYIDGTGNIDGTGIAVDAEGPLFRTVRRDGNLTGNALHRINAFELVRKGAAAAGVKTRQQPLVPRHWHYGVRKFGESLENAALMANHASTRTTRSRSPLRRRDTR